MSEETSSGEITLALSTKVEESFVSPLTAIRGALEILRDHPDLDDAERQGFVMAALGACARLEAGIEELASSVYAAGRRAATPAEASEPAKDSWAARIRLDRDTGIADLDFSDLEFSSAAMVNEVYDAIDAAVIPSRRKWYFVVNHTNTRIWPEAWVTSAHRAKKIAVNFAEAVVRYSEEENPVDRELLASREAALEKVAELRAG